MSDAPKKRRRRFKQTVPLAEGLRAAADLARQHAAGAVESAQRELLLKQALAAENVAQIGDLLTGGQTPAPAPARPPRQK